MPRAVSINSDVGESIGIHAFGSDEEIIRIVDTVNVACGFHAGDPGSMQQIIDHAAEHGVTVGAHPGLPDLAGFGRRAMEMTADEVRDLTRYQVGALVGFLDARGLPLDHVKPHGALFAMTARDDDLMRAVCDVALQYRVPVFGLAGTAHERVSSELGVDFISELYVDLRYSDEGMVIIERQPGATDVDLVRRRVLAAVVDGVITTVGGVQRAVLIDSICVHSDLPQATTVATAIRDVLDKVALSMLKLD